jgi:hypothetical protein
MRKAIDAMAVMPKVKAHRPTVKPWARNHGASRSSTSPWNRP